MTESPTVASGSANPSPAPSTTADWERDLLSRLSFASLLESRRARRWSIFFKLAVLVYALVLLGLYLPKSGLMTAAKGERHTALVEIQGVIAEDSLASADRVITGLRAAFEDDDTAGVIIRINSPGGSPVQAGYINDEIARLREEHPDTPLYAVISDICASGGYYVAAAADEIYADKASVVGSIGVLMNGFGFVDAMKKLGVERRLLTAGKSKGLLDPFSPTKPEDVAHLKQLLGQIHTQFISIVKKGRGDRLKNDDSLFTGLVWTGEQSVALGLVDSLGSSSYVAREVIGEKEIVDFTPRRDYLERFAERIGVAMAQAMTSGLEGVMLK